MDGNQQDSDQQARLDLIIHPLRLRIIRLLEGRERTISEIGEILVHIPQATLYRHINKLQQGGIIQIMAERAVRGAKERTYALVGDGIYLRQRPLELNRKELIEFTGRLEELLDSYSDRLPAADRELRLFSGLIIPEV